MNFSRSHELVARSRVHYGKGSCAIYRFSGYTVPKICLLCIIITVIYTVNYSVLGYGILGLIFYAANYDFDRSRVLIEESFKRPFGLVKFEAVGNEFLCVDESTFKEVRCI
jgi:hypothetical protein